MRASALVVAMSTIRTWTLKGLSFRGTGRDRCGVPASIEPDVPPGETIEVIEAASTLDLLERAYWEVKHHRVAGLVGMQLVEDLESVLRAHGRLGGET